MQLVLALGAAVLWWGIAIQARYETRKIRANYAQRSDEGSALKISWYAVFLGTGVAYFATGTEILEKNPIAVLIGLAVIGSLVWLVAGWILKSSAESRNVAKDSELAVDPHAVTPQEGKRGVSVPSVLLTLVLLRFLFSKRK